VFCDGLAFSISHKIINYLFYVGLAAIVTQIPSVDAFRWSGWYLAFHGTIQMLVVLVIFKENWSDLKRASVNCKRLSILSGIAVPFYVSFNVA